ncbi:MAG: endopeptidase La [Firmicutes bacterium]|nr:endopeptidase La [Bacillota bacterium]
MADEIITEETSTRTMPLIALRGVSVFPRTEVRFDIEREKSIQALEAAMSGDSMIFLANQKDPGVDLPTAKDLYTVGTAAKIKRILRMPGEQLRVLVSGQYRARVKKMVSENPYFAAEIQRIEEKEDVALTPDVLAIIRTASGLYAQYRADHQRFPNDDFRGFDREDQPGFIADFIITQMDVQPEEAQKVLMTVDPVKRLTLVVKYLVRETEIAKYEDQLNTKLQNRLNKSQREHYLMEQMRTIQEELGQEDDIKSEAEEWKKQLKKLKLSPEITEKVEKEINRAAKLPPYAADLAVIRSYVEWILDLPWNKSTKQDIEIKEAQKILDEDHYGLEKVKERILEYLAVLSLAGSEKGPILCLVGPPGVGKTSIARSIARATGRKFVHMSLGGVRDEAEIRGHRRTYIGAIPGRIMTAIRECKSSNPVFLFDEVDKIGADYKGDPASALLEVLDPEQNREFVDHYLEVPFDLSNVMFITTANTTETIPRPLLDRMEVLEISGYTEEEKQAIAKKYLIPKQIKAHGLENGDISISPGALKALIESYTRESGVRGLEKEIANLCRKVARKVVEGEKEKHSVTANNLESYLGKKRYHYDKLLGKNEVGVATGMAWTVVGGDTLFIETAALPGTGHIVLTGQLGDVMQESARAAISYVRSRSADFGIEEDFYKTKDIHIHVPEGATPKDVPSAGVTMCVSVISALTGRPVRKDVAMTGEISLRGKILPVGGIKEKVLAAHRMGVSTILLPEENKADLDDLPKAVRDELRFVLLDTADDALKEALI